MCRQLSDGHADRHAPGYAAGLKEDLTGEGRAHLAGKQWEEADLDGKRWKKAAFKEDTGIMPRTTRLPPLGRRSSRLPKCVMISS